MKKETSRQSLRQIIAINYYTKNILLVCFALIGFKSFAQYSDLKIENNGLIYEKVFDVDGFSADQVEQSLITSIPAIRGISKFQRSDNVITATIDHVLINYKKYGGKWGNTGVYMNHPFVANVTIQWKEGRYKVVVSNMYFDTEGMGRMDADDIYLTRKRGFATAPIIVRSGDYLEKYLTDLFIIKATTKDDW